MLFTEISAYEDKECFVLIKFSSSVVLFRHNELDVRILRM
jgi:hypothetical protein